MGRPKKKTLKEVLAAIHNSGGVKAVVARRLGVSRVTLNSYLKEWATARQALSDEEEDTSDMAESVIRQNIMIARVHQQPEMDAEGNPKGPGQLVDTADAWRWLRTRRRDKFAEKTEIAEEGTQIIIGWDDSEPPPKKKKKK